MMKIKVFSLVIFGTLMFNGCGSEEEKNDNIQISKKSSQYIRKAIIPILDSKCHNGGVILDIGIDINSNGILDESEINKTEIVCNGIDGINGAKGIDGTKGAKGIDGTNGVDGINGASGLDGLNSLISMMNVNIGNINCHNGGLQINSGLDDNANNVLDTNEIDDTKYVCIPSDINQSIQNDTIYSLSVAHPSASIDSNSNKIFFTIYKRDSESTFSVIETHEIGSFKGSDEFDMYYSYEDKPFNGYSKTSFYEDTKFEGLKQREMYASLSKEKLIQKIKKDINNSECQKYPENFSGGNLNRDDNFWTYFCPTLELKTTIENF